MSSLMRIFDGCSSFIPISLAMSVDIRLMQDPESQSAFLNSIPLMEMSMRNLPGLSTLCRMLANVGSLTLIKCYLMSSIDSLLSSKKWLTWWSIQAFIKEVPGGKTRTASLNFSRFFLLIRVMCQRLWNKDEDCGYSEILTFLKSSSMSSFVY